MHIQSLPSGSKRKTSPLIVLVIVGMLAMQSAQARSTTTVYSNDYQRGYSTVDIVVPIILFASLIALFCADVHAHRVVRYHYVVVPRPQTVVVRKVPAAPDTAVQETPAATESRTVRVQNSNGSQTPVVLRLIDGKWRGPRGEIYDSFPTDEQLHSAYGF